MSIKGILEGPVTGDEDAAWGRFLEKYSGFILRVVNRYEHDEESISDCYVFVCEKLCDDGFRRLRQFDADGPARFTTWLAAVTNNLCIDWRRQRFGRRRPLQAVGRLPALDQAVFHMLFEIGATRYECVRVLQADYPDVTEHQVMEISARIHSLLSPRQRFHLQARRRESVSLSDVELDGLPVAGHVIPAAAVEDSVALTFERKRLRAALAKLEPDDRLILQLRFQRDLSLREITDLMVLPDPSSAHRRIQGALEDLARLMEA